MVENISEVNYGVFYIMFFCTSISLLFGMLFFCRKMEIASIENPKSNVCEVSEEDISQNDIISGSDVYSELLNIRDSDVWINSTHLTSDDMKKLQTTDTNTLLAYISTNGTYVRSYDIDKEGIIVGVRYKLK